MRKSPFLVERLRYNILILHLFNAEYYIEDLPTAFSDINERPDQELWSEAVRKEIDALKMGHFI